MAEDTPQEEKTEEPTARRIEKAREDGQVLRSQDMTIAVVTIGFIASLYSLSFFLAPRFIELFRDSLTFSSDSINDQSALVMRLANIVGESYLVLSPVLAISVLLAIFGATALDGFVFSWKAIAPKASKINPISGLVRIFGLKAVVELVKSVLKFSLVALTAGIYLYSNFEQVLLFSRGDIASSIYDATAFVLFGALIVSVALAVIAAIDVPYQRYELIRKLKMTKQEIKDEFKDIEGQPEVRQKIKQKQREMAEQRMLQDVPAADVVITNPEHFAVALSYDKDSEAAPKVLAKGKGLIAQKIKEIAKENQVLVFESPQLARAIYFTTELGHYIPQALFLAVAQVIAYVFGLGMAKEEGTSLKKPKPKVPKELWFDENGRRPN
jgi:flagellar biosynthetic protein FlhB